MRIGWPELFLAGIAIIVIIAVVIAFARRSQKRTGNYLNLPLGVGLRPRQESTDVSHFPLKLPRWRMVS